MPVQALSPKERKASWRLPVEGTRQLKYIRTGLVDEIQIYLVPVLLGSGVRLFDLVGGAPFKLAVFAWRPPARLPRWRSKTPQEPR